MPSEVASGGGCGGIAPQRESGVSDWILETVVWVRLEFCWLRGTSVLVWNDETADGVEGAAC